MRAWETLAQAEAEDGVAIELRRRGHEFLIRAGGRDLMSSDDEPSSNALAELGCARLRGRPAARVLVGGLGMGFTLRAALDACGPAAVVEVAELVPAVAKWNRGPLRELAGDPLGDPRCALILGDVERPIAEARAYYDAILLDVDNGPDALAHPGNDSLYSAKGLARIHAALARGGTLAVWSFSDDPRFIRRLQAQGFSARPHRVSASRKGRGRYHVIFVAERA